MPSLSSKHVPCMIGVILAWIFFGPCAAWGQDIQSLLNKLTNKDPQVRRSAIQSKELASCFSEDEEDPALCPSRGEQDFNKLVDVLIQLLKDRDPMIREYTVIYLSHSTVFKAVKAIVPLLHDPDADVRYAAAGAFDINTMSPREDFSAEENASFVNSLEGLLKDKDARVRRVAAISLVFNGTAKSLLLLREAYKREPDPEVRETYSSAIRDLEKDLERKKHQNK